MPAMSDTDLARVVKVLAEDAISWNQQRGADRITAMEYYDGVMNDTPSLEGRSKFVSRDFRAATKKVMPSILRTIMGGENIVEYPPVGEGDEAAAEQATAYVNRVVIPESEIGSVIEDAIHDALRIRNGILKWWWDTKREVKVSEHSGLAPDEFEQLAADDGVSVLEHGMSPDGMVSCKIRRVTTTGKLCAACIPNEEFFINSDALSFDDAPFIAHNMRLRRSTLVAMGYDKDRVYDLPVYGTDTDQQAEELTRRDDMSVGGRPNEAARDMEEIDYWECFVRVDTDDDGIAELRRVCFAGGWNEENILSNDDWDDVPFADVVIERRPHEWLGRSLFDDIHELQRVKTVLFRSTLDNLYWQNNLQPIVQEEVVTNPEAVTNPKFGKPIIVQNGVDVRAAIGFHDVPFVAKESFAMLTYMDEVLQDRTGISDAAGGLPPDAMQNMTATATAIIEQAGLSQVEHMVRNVAKGLRKFFKGILRLIIQHQDKPRMVRLNDTWTQFDPRSWNSNMDASVNVGLGAGTRERDMMAMQIVNMTQEKLLTAFGPDNPFVTPDNLYNSVAKLYESAGLKTVGLYLTKPSPEAIQAKLDEAKNAPNPEIIKIQGQMQLAQMKAEADQQKEAAQMQADIETKRADLEKEQITRQQDMQVDAAKGQMQAQLEREKMAAQLQMKREELQHEAMMKQAELAQQRELEILKLGASQNDDGSVTSKGDKEAAKFSEMFEGQRAAMEALIQGMNRPKRIVRDPVTNRALGVETIQDTVQ